MSLTGNATNAVRHKKLRVLSFGKTNYHVYKKIFLFTIMDYNIVGKSCGTKSLLFVLYYYFFVQ